MLTGKGNAAVRKYKKQASENQHLFGHRIHLNWMSRVYTTAVKLSFAVVIAVKI